MSIKIDFKTMMLGLAHLILMVLSPIASTVIITYKLFKDKKIEIIYFYLGPLLVLFSGWIPKYDFFDIIKHYSFIDKLRVTELSETIDRGLRLFNPLQYWISVIVSKTPFNYFLGLLMIGTGYILLCRILLIKTKNLSFKTKVIGFLIIIMSLRLVPYLSGIWFYSASIIFAYSIIEEKLNKKIKVLLIIISILIHFSIIIPLALYLLFKISFIKDKIKLYHIAIILILLFFSPYVLIPASKFLYSLTNITAFNYIGTRYEAYGANQANYERFTNYRFIIVEISKPLIIIYSLIILRKLNDYKTKDFFPILLVGFSLFLGLQYRVLLRFTSMCILFNLDAILLSLNSIYIKNKSWQRVLFLTPTMSFLLLQTAYELYAIYNSGLLDY